MEVAKGHVAEPDEAGNVPVVEMSLINIGDPQNDAFTDPWERFTSAALFERVRALAHAGTSERHNTALCARAQVVMHSGQDLQWKDAPLLPFLRAKFGHYFQLLELAFVATYVTAACSYHGTEAFIWELIIIGAMIAAVRRALPPAHGGLGLTRFALRRQIFIMQPYRRHVMVVTVLGLVALGAQVAILTAFVADRSKLARPFPGPVRARAS